MKNVLIAVLIVVIIALLLIIPAGCDKKVIPQEKGDFEVISRTYVAGFTVYKVYDTKTMVVYAMFENGSISPLYNADGTLRLYDGE